MAKMTDLNQKPRLRFKGFTEAWEQHKLGECFSERVESMPDGELISVTINDGIKKFSELGRHDNSNDNKSKYKKVCVGDIAYNSMRMWQGASGYSPYEGIVSPAYTVLSPNAGVFSRCIAYQFKLPQMIHTFQINSQGITSDNWNLKYPTLSEIEIYISKNVAEQKQIAEFFTSLDNLITLHQRKYEKLKSMKTALLEKMFPAGNDTSPKIRFKGFTEAWEQRKVGSLVDLYESKTKIENEYPVLSSTMSGIFLQKDYFNQEVSTITNAGYKIVPYGFITYRSMSDTEVFHFNVQNIVGKGIVSPAYPVFSTKEKIIDSYFLTYQMNNSFSFFKQLILLKEGGTRYALSFKKLSEIFVAYPCFNEQEKISKLLKDLDSLITLHQRKCEKLKNLKKSLLERMFI